MTTTFETLKAKQIEQGEKIQDGVGAEFLEVANSLAYGHESGVELNAKCAFVNAQACGQVLNNSMLVHSLGARLEVVIG